MAGAAHELLVMALREQPEVLVALLQRLAGRSVPGPIAFTDSAVRFADVNEVRPDLLYTGTVVPWLVVEVQHEIDKTKPRRWALLTGVLLDEHGRMGELVVVTARRCVARWARRAVTWQGAVGTSLRVRPVVLYVSFDLIEQHLLDPNQPALALVAAWALQHRYGPRAKTTLARAVELTERLPEPMRSVQLRAMLQMLNARLLAYVQELTMNLDAIPKSEAFQKFEQALEARGEARGEAKALLKYLERRGVEVTPARRARVEACTDAAELERWLDAAFSAEEPEAIVAAVFGAG